MNIGYFFKVLTFREAVFADPRDNGLDWFFFFFLEMITSVIFLVNCAGPVKKS